MPNRPAKSTNPPADHAAISTAQMRHLHALLRDHGISGDKTVHDYLNRALDEAGESPVESRSDLTTRQAAAIIATLEAAPVAHTAGAQALAALRAPFPAEALGKLPRSTCKACSDSPRKRCEEHRWISRCPECGNNHSAATMHIDYVGHADVTARLLEVDPAWTWDFAATNPDGVPFIDNNGGLWIRLTVLGVSRLGYGDPGKNKGRPDGMKEAIGDALRNAAMRFGVALDLWAKGDREWAHAEKSGAEESHPDSAPPAERTAPPYSGPPTSYYLDKIGDDADALGITFDQITTKMRAALGVASVTDLENVDPWLIRPWAEKIQSHREDVLEKREQEAENAAREAAAKAAEAPAAPDTPAADDPWAAPLAGTDGPVS